jgi:peptidoglycan LD-endopeptidase CwlK
MPKFGAKSSAQLLTCHPDLQRVFNEVVKRWDCTVIEGARTVAQQEENMRRGVSQTMASKHIPGPDGYSRAADVAPFPVDWQDSERFRAFGGYVLGTADMLGVSLIWGGDWNGNRDFKDQKFIDLPHFELR